VSTLSSSCDRGVRKTKVIVGAVAIAFLLLFTVFAFVGVFSFVEWLVADVVVALVANLVLRRVGRRTKQ
jgi:hypothetical protein